MCRIMVMSFGLTNAPTMFMDLMNCVFKDLLYQFVIVSLTTSWFTQAWGRARTLPGTGATTVVGTPFVHQVEQV